MKEALANAKFTEGRSDSFFCMAPDHKFIIKTIPGSEALKLQRIHYGLYNVCILANTNHSTLKRIQTL